MPKFEQMPAGDGQDQERSDQIQILAESKYAKANEEDGGEERLGPPNPENYEKAEEALNELLDRAQAERYTVESFGRKLGVILGSTPITIGVIMSAVADSMRSPAGWAAVGQKKRSFLESLRKEWSESPNAAYLTPKYSAAWELKELKKDTEKLKDARNRSDLDWRFIKT